MPTKLQTCQPRKILVALDLGEYSEKIISYLFLLTRDILSEYTIFHCLEGTGTQNEAQARICQILQHTEEYRNKALGSSINIHIASGSLIEELQTLHGRESFGAIFIGTTNATDTWQMGSTAQAILTNLQISIVAIPPAIELAFPSNTSILLEKMNEASCDFMHIIHDFMAYYDIFLNFVLFAKDKHKLEEEKKLIEEYERFFDSTFTFSFLVEQEQTFLNFLKYVEAIHCQCAMVAWDETTTAYQEAKQTGFVYCSPKLPLLYMKHSTTCYGHLQLAEV